MNTFTIAGHLVTNLELKTKGEPTWTWLRVATNNGHGIQRFWVTAFGKLAENLVKHLAEGDGIAIRGELRVTTHNDKERTELIARTADFFRSLAGALRRGADASLRPLDYERSGRGE